MGDTTETTSIGQWILANGTLRAGSLRSPSRYLIKIAPILTPFLAVIDFHAVKASMIAPRIPDPSTPPPRALKVGSAPPQKVCKISRFMHKRAKCNPSGQTFRAEPQRTQGGHAVAVGQPQKPRPARRLRGEGVQGCAAKPPSLGLVFLIQQTPRPRRGLITLFRTL